MPAQDPVLLKLLLQHNADLQLVDHHLAWSRCSNSTTTWAEVEFSRSLIRATEFPLCRSGYLLDQSLHMAVK